MARNDNPTTENRPRFSFIIVSYNTLPLTRAAVSSIAKYASHFPHEVILVDNHSTDGSVEALRREFAGLKIIALEENRGFAAANNAGANIAAGDWLVLMNSDAELFVDTMSAIDDLLRRHAQLDVLGGQLLNPDGSLQTSVLTNYHLVRNEQRELVEVSGIVGAFMVVRRVIWQKLNGMDEGYFFYNEDVDFCDRAINAGAVLRWSPRFRVMHHRSGSSKKVNLRAIVELWDGYHYSWRKEMSEQEYRSKVRRYGFRCFFRVIWYFSLSLLTVFLLPAFSARLHKYFHLLKWHLRGCPAGWGLRPVGNKPLQEPSSDKSQTNSQAPGPLITVAICTRNRAKFLQRTVKSVLPQMTDETELLIVDNTSIDDTAEVVGRLAAANPCLTVCRENEIGVSAARNTAFKKARGQYVLFLDDDELADAGWLQTYMDFFKKPPSSRVGCVGGPYVAQHEIALPAWMDPNYGGFDVGGDQRILTCGTNLAGGNCAYPRVLACRFGGFDARLTRYEDSDLNIRLRNAGYETWWLPNARIFHQLPADRLNFRAIGGIAFNEGRSVALLRLRKMHGNFSRTTYRLGRIVITPFHMLFCLLAALFTLPRRHGQTSAGYLLRTIRIAGIGWQMLADWRNTTRERR